MLQRQDDTRAVVKVLPKRLAKFGLSLNRKKTKIIQIGKSYAYRQRASGKRLMTFDFLGFTHYWGTSKRGFLRLKRKTAKSRLRRGLVAINQWLKDHRNLYPLQQIWRIISSKVRGHINYFGVTDNAKQVELFRHKVEKLLFSSA